MNDFIEHDLMFSEDDKSYYWQKWINGSFAGTSIESYPSQVDAMEALRGAEVTFEQPAPEPQNAE